MADEKRKNIAIPIGVHQKVRIHCVKRNRPIWREIARWCIKGMIDDKEAEKAARKG